MGVLCPSPTSFELQTQQIMKYLVKQQRVAKGTPPSNFPRICSLSKIHEAPVAIIYTKFVPTGVSPEAHVNPKPCQHILCSESVFFSKPGTALCKPQASSLPGGQHQYNLTASVL